MYSPLSTLNTTTEVPLSKAPNPPTAPRAPQHKWLHTAPGVCSLLCVCTLDGLNAEHKFRVWVTILGRMSRHVTSQRTPRLFYPPECAVYLELRCGITLLCLVLQDCHMWPWLVLKKEERSSSVQSENKIGYMLRNSDHAQNSFFLVTLNTTEVKSM